MFDKRYIVMMMYGVSLCLCVVFFYLFSTLSHILMLIYGFNVYAFTYSLSEERVQRNKHVYILSVMTITVLSCLLIRHYYGDHVDFLFLIFNVLLILKAMLRNKSAKASDMQLLGSMLLVLYTMAVFLSIYSKFTDYYGYVFAIPLDILSQLLISSSIVFLINFFIIKRKIKYQALQAMISPSKRSIPISPVILDQEVNRIESVMQKKQLYLVKDIKMQEICENIGIEPVLLQTILFEYYQCDFNEWISNYRIQYVLDQMEQTDYDYTLEALAQGAGFKSRTTFNKYFKEIVGCTPSVYRRQLNY